MGPKKKRARVDAANSSQESGPGENFPPSTAGQILRIELRDFMNHTCLDLDLEPNKVNYITGRNGAGKSSVIQAVVLALGGNASATKRATNVKDFVRRGCNKAEIRVKLSNVGGEESLKPEVFGDAIVMERVIYVSRDLAQSRHFVRDAEGRVVHHKGFKNAAEQKEHICSHFNIQVDNPTMILQQEEAKTFFMDDASTSVRAKRLDGRLHDFFFQGTMLAKAVEDYKRARMDHTDSEASLAEKDEHKTKSDEEERKMRQLYELMLKLNQHDNSEMLTAKQLVIKARNAEAEAEALSEKIQRHSEKADRAKDLYEEKEGELKGFKVYPRFLDLRSPLPKSKFQDFIDILK